MQQIGARPKAAQSSGQATGLALAGAIATMVANFGIAVLVAGAGASFAGVFFAATAVVTIIGNSTGLGTMTGLVYFMPNVLDGPAPNPRLLVAIALRPVILASAAAAIAVAAMAGALATIITPDHAATTSSALRLLAIAIPGWALTVSLLGATRGLGSMTPTVVVNQVVKPLGQLALVGAVLTVDREPSSAAVALAWTIPVVASAILATLWLWRLGGFARPDAGAADHANRGAVSRAEFWAYTRPRALSTTFQIALERIDVILIAALAGAPAAGIYGAITRFVTAGNFLIFAIAQATSPNMRRALAGERRADAARLLRQATGWMVLLAWPYFLLLATKSGPLVNLLNPDFSTGTGALTLLAVVMLVNAFAGPVDLTLLMLGRSKASLAATAAALAADITLAFLLVPRFGLIGAALAWGAAVAIQNGTATVLVHRIGDLRATGPGSLVAAAGALVAVVPAGLLLPDSFVGLIGTVVVAGLVLPAWAVRFRSVLGLPS